MATANDGVSTYQSTGAGGKFRKRPVRRSSHATPYDRPPTSIRNNNNNNNNNPSLFSKLVNPASRLIYAGADRLFGVFRKRLPSAPAPRLTGISEEPRSRSQEAVPNSASKYSTGVVEPSTNEGGNMASISVATEISDLENMLKQKTFTRSEIERLTELLLSRTKESNVVEGDKEKLPSTSYHVQRSDVFTSCTLNKCVEEREIGNLEAAFATPVVNSRVFEDDGASPAELAKAYMGTRSTKLSPLTIRPSSQARRHDSVLLNNTSAFPQTPTTSLVPKTASAIRSSENGLTTFRSRGRSALYNMPRTPYYRGPSTLSQKGVASPSAWEHEGSIESSRMAGKRRSSALDDIRSGGPMRRIRQKGNLLSQQSSISKRKSESGSSQKLLLRNEPEPKGPKAAEETGEISKRNQSYGSVPTESSQMALKIFEQLDRMSPKEKLSGSKLAGTVGKIDSLKLLSNSHENQKSEGQHRVSFSDARESTFQSKSTIEENGSRNIAGHSNVPSSVNGSFTFPVSGYTPAITKAGSATKQAFSMSAHEDSLELDDDNRSNGHASISLGENKKLGTSVLANNEVSTGKQAETSQTTGSISDSRKGAISTALPEVVPIPGVSESKKGAISPGGSIFNNQKMSFNISASTLLNSNNQSSVPSQPTSIAGTVAPQNKPAVFPTFGTSTPNGAGSFGVKPNISPDAKPLGSISLTNSTMNNDQVKFSASNKDDNGNTQKPVNLFGNSGPSFSANLTTTSASGTYSFGGSTNNSSVINGASASSPPVFVSSSSFQPSGTNTNTIFSSSSSPVISSATTAFVPSTTTAAPATNSDASTPLNTSVPAPVFSFGSATASSTSASMTPSSPFAGTSFAPSSNGGSIFGLNSSSATLTTNGFQTNTQVVSTAATQTVPFKFGSGTSGMPSSTSASSLFSSSAPSFGLTPAVTTSDIKSGGSTSSSTTNIFGSGSSATPSYGLTPAVTSSEIKLGGSTSSSTTNVFGSGASSTPSFGLSSTVASSEVKSGSTPFSFGASSTSMPSTTSSPFMFGSSNTGASTGSSTSMPSATSSPFMFGSSSTGASIGSSTIMSSAPSSTFMFGSSSTGASTGSSTNMSSATSSPFMFGSSNTGASTGSPMFSFSSNPPSPAPVFGNSTPVFGVSPTNNNDHMSMEDSMADDSNQAPSPSVPAFGQAPNSTPGFMFGSTTPSTPPVVPFQFGGQTNQPQAQQTSQNPFAAPGGSPFNAGGSFSLGSGGDDKSNRRILKVKRQNRRK